MRRPINRLLSALAIVAALACSPLAETASPAASAQPIAPPPDCESLVAYDRDRMMPGYLLPTSAGEMTCIPFSSVAVYPPADYRGDFYVDEFTDCDR